MPTEINSQADLDAAIAAGETRVIVRKSIYLSLSVSLTVEAWGSSSPTVEARESSSPTVVAWESSSPTVVAWGSSSPTVEARESSSPRVEARGFVMLRILGHVVASLSASVMCRVQGKTAKVEGGAVVYDENPATPQAWCDHYGVQVVDGVATLYKGVNDKYTTDRGTDYSPGQTPVAPDWDGGDRECGGGLHFSPHPTMTLEFYGEATKFLACPVSLADMSVHPSGNYPQKVKARGCCGPTVEVDRDGNVVEQTEVATA